MTIKQLADELGLSKQAIRKHVSKLPPTMVSTGANKTILINDEGTEIIRNTVSTKSTTVDTNLISTVDTLVGMLEKELDDKNSQIDSLSRVIEVQAKQLEIAQQNVQELTTALGRQQALHAGTIQKQLETENSEYKAGIVEPDIQEKRTGLFARLFKRI